MSNCDLTPSGMYKSLTGYDEIAIRKAFGETIEQLGASGADGKVLRPTMLARGLAFVHRRRLGDKDGAAHVHVMNLTVDEANDYFEDEPDEDGDLEQDAEGEAPSA